MLAFGFFTAVILLPGCQGGFINLGKEGACTWYIDDDLDGFGRSGDPGVPGDCDVVDQGYSLFDTDCDDGDPDLNPAAIEICDGLDQDCDGEVDEDPSDAITFYRDADQDGFGDALQALDACSAPAGYVENTDDCYDFNPEAAPDATDFHDKDRGDGSYDYDCDGTVTLESEAVGACSASCALEQEGWLDAPPSCGEDHEWVTGCTTGPEGTCEPVTEERTQGCR